MVTLFDISLGFSRPKSKRVGRGTGSGLGKTAGRGSKGNGSRAGARDRRAYEGGQKPLYRKVAKRGFSAGCRDKVLLVSADQLALYASNEPLSVDKLRILGKGSRRSRVKVLGNIETSLAARIGTEIARSRK